MLLMNNCVSNCVPFYLVCNYLSLLINVKLNVKLFFSPTQMLIKTKPTESRQCITCPIFFQKH